MWRLLCQQPYLTQVISALTILQPDEPIDAETLDGFVDLAPKQISRCLSKLHGTGYVAKIGANGHYSLYIPTQRRMPTDSASVERTYRRYLKKPTRTNYRAPARQLAKEISEAVIKAIRSELTLQRVSTASGKTFKQLVLFKTS